VRLVAVHAWVEALRERGFDLIVLRPGVMERDHGCRSH
jgi:hypothetical protein